MTINYFLSNHCIRNNSKNIKHKMDADYALYQRYQEERKEKQQYLVDNIQNMGYDAGDFAHYLGWQRGKNYIFNQF